MPALFIGHGNPMNAIEENQFTSTWQAIGRMFPKPRAVLGISAHWCLDSTSVTTSPRPPTLHDFSGFPHLLSDFNYAAPGDPALAERLREVLAPTPVLADARRGLDHGCWSVLAHLLPEADVPVVQLSMDVRQALDFHYQLGRRLSVLRDEGILILASGNVVHNLRAKRDGEGSPAYPWASRVEDVVKTMIETGNHAALLDPAALDPEIRVAIPTLDHYVPLLYVLGAQREGEEASLLVKGIDLGSISMLSIAVGLDR